MIYNVHQRDHQLGPPYWHSQMIICFMNKFATGLLCSFKGSIREEKGNNRKFSGDKLLLSVLVPRIKCLVEVFLWIMQMVLWSVSQFITTMSFPPLCSTKEAAEGPLSGVTVSQAPTCPSSNYLHCSLREWWLMELYPVQPAQPHKTALACVD